MGSTYHDVSQAYISCLITENRELRERLSACDSALDKLSQVASDRPDDDHGNADRVEWMDRVLQTVLSTLQETGHPTTQQRGVLVPDFMRCRA